MASFVSPFDVGTVDEVQTGTLGGGTAVAWPLLPWWWWCWCWCKWCSCWLSGDVGWVAMDEPSVGVLLVFSNRTRRSVSHPGS